VDKQREQAKTKQLDWAELQALNSLEKSKSATAAPSTASSVASTSAPSFFERLTTKVLNNIQIHVSDVHLRYEDPHTNSTTTRSTRQQQQQKGGGGGPPRGSTLGFTLRSLHVYTVDSNGRRAFMTRPYFVHRMLTVVGLAVSGDVHPSHPSHPSYCFYGLHSFTPSVCVVVTTCLTGVL